MKILKMGLCVALLLTSGLSVAAPASDYWPIWNKSNEANQRVIDHAALDAILRTYVVSDHASGINRFRYGDVKRKHRKQLGRYIQTSTNLDPRDYSRAEQKAYWLNLYNALTLELILDNYPVDSVENIPGPGGSGAKGPWDKKVTSVAGQKISLNDIEHRILRPLWQDHRVHFGLACGGLGCPNLQPEAFTSTNSRELLKKSGYEFVKHPRGVKLENGELHVSKLFEWYKDDFAKSDKKLLKVFAHYSSDRDALYLLGFNGKIDYTHDWRINAP
ncbi:MAG: DUF547 domain-containing protein [Gammaproteobacteria bacterium]|nr:DUF547 domain-containing protein [Gammaproteobacteria bacterium]MBQ0840062.1 DUF547 domain-containing protein [Gammaproteobacteria bacterium]